ncbi:1-acyl-sn-glycerol-3-phosphate acyltransferase [Planctomycetes bacterium Pla163]|uniref:1-acyl-sn-glycerol-3-phosphate acyltransferase n=1 Tax=Rohdeia mirabilis TaxID=2528008 RepID=A0A518D0G0_9BACT|nr:1-acyl-sn-glycerol-3-phosphate acyltransferase [Planctomycetes bacterium Pla163]
MFWRHGGGYRLMRSIIWLLLWPLERMTVVGLEKIPAEGGALVVANHQSMLDIPVIGTRVKRSITFVARDTLRKNPILRFVLHTCGGITVKRGSADRAALAAIIAALEAGECVAIFPEGTRSKDGEVKAFQRGALVVAKRAGVPIIPVGLAGTGAAWPAGQALPGPGRIGMVVGDAIAPDTPDAAEVARAAVAELVLRADAARGARG